MALSKITNVFRLILLFKKNTKEEKPEMLYFIKIYF